MRGRLGSWAWLAFIAVVLHLFSSAAAIGENFCEIVFSPEDANDYANTQLAFHTGSYGCALLCDQCLPGRKGPAKNSTNCRYYDATVVRPLALPDVDFCVVVKQGYYGDITFGSGNDCLINDGKIFGHVDMGAGNDAVINSGQMATVQLGLGADLFVSQANSKFGDISGDPPGAADVPVSGKDVIFITLSDSPNSNIDAGSDVNQVFVRSSGVGDIKLGRYFPYFGTQAPLTVLPFFYASNSDFGSVVASVPYSVVYVDSSAMHSLTAANGESTATIVDTQVVGDVLLGRRTSTLCASGNTEIVGAVESGRLRDCRFNSSYSLLSVRRCNTVELYAGCGKLVSGCDQSPL